LILKNTPLNETYFLNNEYIFYLNLILLTSISLIDDKKDIHPVYRFTAQIVCVISSLTLLDPEISKFLNFFPNKLILFIALFFWIYLINISNFLDGSDGYLTVNSISFFLNLMTLTIFKNDLPFLKYVSFIMIAILISFLYYNKNPAKIFMGDSGSIFIGYLIGFCSLKLIINSYWYIAITLLSYPFLDVSLTILRKIKNNQYPWARLFDYFFLRALVKSNYNHNKILKVTIYYNIFIFLLVITQILFDIKYLFILAILGSLIKIRKFHLMSS
jgi:UDP-N-acetylmuramyl pentapeptide phosphotransferase/UDP-N-acetylglucosamine-1-phosphate transferase